MAVKIHNCDVMAGLRAMPDDYFDCVITSPPYWGLRDYGVEGQLGMEPTLGQHLDAMVRVFAEVHRVMKPTGTLWLNYGDCYAAAPNGRSAAATKAAGNDDRTFRDKPMSTIGGVLKSKDWCMIPNRLAIALQEWGWWCRSECIWAKPNPMPESVRDRPATAHEKVFMLTKAAKYFYNGDAVRQPCVGTSLFEKSTGVGFRYQDATREKIRVKGKGGISAPGYDDRKQRDDTGNTRPPLTMRDRQYNPLGRNLHNWEPPPLQVWEIATQGFKDAHFATFPPELVERCLKAGCPDGGKVLDPFGGAGTTALVADHMGLDCHLIELSGEYAHMALRRIQAAAPLVVEASISETVQAEMFPVDAGGTIGAKSEPGETRHGIKS